MSEKTYGKWWVKGDLNAFFGLFVNIITNTLVLTTLLLYVVKIPSNVVFGRVLPALGLSIIVGNVYYALMARRLAKKEKRDDVTALPYGTGVEHIFVCTFVVMGPVFWKTGDPILALEVGMAWCAIEGIIEVLGAFFGEQLRRITPQAAMLGSVSGLAISIIAMNPAMQSWEVPYIAFISIALFLIGWVANRALPLGLPAGLIMVVAGSILAWCTGYMNPAALAEAASTMGLSVPTPYFQGLVHGFKDILPYLATALPLGIGNVVGAMDQVESAAVAGDKYNLREVLVVDGIGSLLGAAFGNPFPTCVYIGHPGWKSIGGRVGYSMLTGICVMVICCLGMVQVFLAIIPLEAVLPILLYIGLVIGAQAYEAVPKKHFVAITFAMIPWVANWGLTLANNVLSSVGTSAAAEGVLASLYENNVYYQGLESLGNGPVLTSMVLASVTVFIVDGKFKHAVVAALIGATCSYFGFMHAASVGLGMATEEAIGYIAMAAVIFLYKIYKDTSREPEALTSKE